MSARTVTESEREKEKESKLLVPCTDNDGSTHIARKCLLFVRTSYEDVECCDRKRERERSQTGDSVNVILL